MIVDGHTHLFMLDTKRYPLANSGSDYRPVLEGSAVELRRRMDEAGIDRALTITTGFYGWDNQYTFDQLRGNRTWLATGVLVDPSSPSGPDDLVRAVLAGACDLRIQRHLHYHRSLDDPVSTPLWRKAAELDLTVDVNATHEEYEAVERRVREFPGTRVILDHCGYVSGELRPSVNTINPAIALSKYDNVFVKLTFISLASVNAYPFADVQWMVRGLVDHFGAERCIFGTNYPAEQYSPKASMKELVALFHRDLGLSTAEQRWIMGDTARRLWKWDETGS